MKIVRTGVVLAAAALAIMASTAGNVDAKEKKGMKSIKSQAAPLQACVGSLDARYPRDAKPACGDDTAWTATAWRGERVHGQFVVWTEPGLKRLRASVTPLEGAGAAIPAECVRPAFVRYVKGDKGLWADVLDSPEPLEVPEKSAQPVWLSIDVPAEAAPGAYKGRLTLDADDTDAVSFDLTLEVLPALLPPPADWRFHLDLWQNPYSVARYHGVRPWSPEHWTLLGQVLRMAADAGQKCLTTTILHWPWNAQTHDAFRSMVKWTRHQDGHWDFDFSLFDQYVEFGATCGLAGQINCYTMVPWGNRVHYYEAETGDFNVIQAKAGTETYREVWKPFLEAFVAHVKEKGWFDRTVIAMDERALDEMMAVVALVNEVAPGLKTALAGNDHAELYEPIYDYCPFITHHLDAGVMAARKDRGQRTTYYVCCGPLRPNTFTFSPPAESAWLGWYAAAHNYDGFLRWAFNSWNADPLDDTTFGNWPAGDCYVIYPGPRSSIRFERLREGIQDYEKVRIVRETLQSRGDSDALRQLDEALARFQYPECGDDAELAGHVNAAKACLAELSREVTP